MEKVIFDLPGAEILLYEKFFSEASADYYFDMLKQEIVWQEKEIMMFGKLVKQPRLVAFYGDKDISYTYSGKKSDALPWCESLLQIKKLIFEKLGIEFNSCLANLYRRGADSMGWHQDNEKELGENPTICSVTFGAMRKFHLRHIADKDNHFDIELHHGSLLLMAGATQHLYKHQIPKTKLLVGPRVNLTFRTIIK